MSGIPLDVRWDIGDYGGGGGGGIVSLPTNLTYVLGNVRFYLLGEGLPPS